jgi:hydrogenase-4 component B
MAERLVMAAIVLAGASGFPGLLFDRRSAWGERIATSVLAMGALLGVGGAVLGFIAPAAEATRRPWSVPGGELALHVDAVAAMFLLQLFVIAPLGAIYGLSYWRQVDHPENGRKLRLFYGLMTAGIALLLVARNAVLFLAGWEVMAIAAFMTVTTEDQVPAVRQVGFIYIVATRVGTLCLFFMFALLAHATGTLRFDGALDARSGGAAGIFLLGLAGFGIKAGVMPGHVWLPGAHASAPSHVSAVMSGVLIKTGIYGLVRMTSLFTSPPLWWGVVLLTLGALSGVLGVAFAIAQHDMKRLLAYHSVENIGIMCLGLGVALVGRSMARPELVALGLGGCLLHVWNHGLFKALLFLGAGAVAHATGTREIDALGGLMRRMPRTGVAFLVGSVAICGLPPLNGFVSELLVYLGLFRSTTTKVGPAVLPSALGAVSLALVGALAVACFVKVFGVVFLGQPRSPAAARAVEAPAKMTTPMFVLATVCLTIGLAPVLVTPILDRAVQAYGRNQGTSIPPLVTLAPLTVLTVFAGVLVACLTAVAFWLARRTRGAPSQVGTWDCGYAAPTVRMQYTASSFAQALVGLFWWVLRPSEHRPHLRGIFPGPQRFESHVEDTVLDGFLLPLGRLVARGFKWLRWLHLGKMHAYLLYILATVVLLLLRWFPR